MSKSFEVVLFHRTKFRLILVLFASLVSCWPAFSLAEQPSCLPLHALSAAAKGQIARLHDLFQEGADVNTKDAKGRSLLHVAVEHDHLETVKFLLTASAAPNLEDEMGITPLQLAMKNSNQEIAFAITRSLAKLDDYKSDGWLPLHYAAFAGENEVVDYLLKQTGQVNVAATGVTPLYLAASQGHAETVKKLLLNHAKIDITLPDNSTALMAAAEAGHSEVVKLLLIAKANVNQIEQHGISPLMLAAQNGHFDIVKLLLFANAHVEQKIADGSTALHLAARQNKLESVSALLEFGANPNSVAKDGSTPLHLAAQMGHEQVVVKLLQYKAEVNAVDKKCNTPLHNVSQHGFVKAAKKLITAGADLNATNQKGSTPLHLAAIADQPLVAKLLVKLGADVNQANRISGESALFYAAKEGNLTVAKVLLQASAALDQAAGKLTPVCVASQNGNAELVNLLQAEGADTDPAICQVKPIRISKLWGVEAF